MGREASHSKPEKRADRWVADGTQVSGWGGGMKGRPGVGGPEGKTPAVSLEHPFKGATAGLTAADWLGGHPECHL